MAGHHPNVPGYRSLAIVCALACTAHADTHFKIHPTDGEFVTTRRACGPKTKDELFTRVIAPVPTLIVGDKHAMTLQIKKDLHPADETIEGVGWWHYDGKGSTKTLVISLRPGKNGHQIISINVIRRMDAIECSERWVGTVEVPDGN